MDAKKVKKIVQDSYAGIAKSQSCCCSCHCSSEDISKSIGYSDDELSLVPEANLGLGCGNPSALGKINDGETVVDLGSGAGIDAFLAAKKVGQMGKVIGIDMTQEMIDLAKKNAHKYGYQNVEFKLGDIEALPLENNSIDVIISNCVINLSPDKQKVFQEAHRVLKSGGRMYLSDIVLLEDLTADQRADEALIAGCVGGALLKEKYLEIIKQVGFEVKILNENTSISKQQYQGLPLESLAVEAIKF